ncbi:MAG: TrkH family potassium uptake protein [Prevotella sp.]|nr:TrkH family potassium uptake protein [Prevotella sp.]
MINLKTIYKVLGTLLYIEAALMLCCLAVTFYYQEDDTFTFLTSVFLTVLCAIILKYKGRESNNSLSRRDAYLVVTLSWLLFSFFGSLPFLIGGYVKNFTDAYFESMSGFSTTGATILSHLDKMPHGLLFWRSLTQWIGGLGIVFFTIALLPSMIGGSVKVFAAEATGPIRSKLHPRLSTNAKWIWSVYLFLTLACVGCFMLFGANWFDAVNYGMTSTATGGFSIHDDSSVFFSSAGIEYTCTLFCFLAGINFTLFYASIAKLKFKNLFKSSEFKLYLTATLSCTIVIAIALFLSRQYDIEEAFRTSLFQVVTFITSTGLANDNVGQWPHFTWILLALLMVLGGCSGSTSGGIKCIRGVMLWKNIRNEFRQILHPNAVLPMRIDGMNVSQQKRVTLLAFLTAYSIICLLAFFILIATGIDSTKSVTIILSCIGNVGPSLDIGIGQSMSWAMLPAAIKWMCMALMLIGRLEIFSVLVIFTPAFWKES